MNSRPRRRSPGPLATLLAIGLTLLPALAAAAVIPESQLQRALRKQRRLLAESPQDATLWNDLGNLMMLGDWHDDAEEAYKKSLEIDPDLVTARYNLALLYQQTHRPARSTRALRRILKHHPDHAWSRYYLGVAHADSGRRRAAIREFAHAIRLEPDLTDPTVNPHVFENKLLADAALYAYADQQGAELAPRLYENRERVVRSMVQPRRLEAAMMEQAEEEAAAEAEAEPEQDDGDEAQKPRRRRRDSGGA